MTLYAKWVSPDYDAADFGSSPPDSNIFYVRVASEWKDAIEQINTRGTGNYVINLTGSFGLPGESTGGGSVNPRITAANSKVSVRGNYKITLNANGNLLYIAVNKTVILRGPTLQGKTSNTGSLVEIGGGTFYLRSGNITGNTTSGDGGGVNISSGTFYMSGGVISGNRASPGGAIALSSSSESEISGGEISSNSAGNNGGGICISGPGKIKIKGGNIKNNTVSGSGGGVYHGGASFTMQDAAQIDQSNDTYLANGKFISVTGALSTSGYAAKITLSSYSAGVVVVTSDSAANSTANNPKFNISSSEWVIADDGVNGKLLSRSSAAASRQAAGNPVYYATLKSAFDASPTTGFSAANPDVVTLLNNITSVDTFTGTGTAGLTLTSGQHIKLVAETGKSYQIKRWSGFTTESFFTVPSGTSLALGDGTANTTLSLDGGAIWTGGTATPPTPAAGATNDTGAGGIQSSAPLIRVSGGTLSLNNGAVLQNHAGGDTGALALSSPGVFNMSGGKITKNKSQWSAAISIADGYQAASTAMNMTGGEITSNHAYASGGIGGGGAGLNINSGTVTMSGGTISGNKADTNGSAVRVEDNQGKFVMSGGTISGNTANGTGGGVYSNGTFTLNSPATTGSITGNTASGATPNVHKAGGTINGTAGVTSGW